MSSTKEAQEIMGKVARLRMCRGLLENALEELKRDDLTDYRRKIVEGVARGERERMRRLVDELRAYQMAGKLGSYTKAVR